MDTTSNNIPCYVYPTMEKFCPNCMPRWEKLFLHCFLQQEINLFVYYLHQFSKEFKLHSGHKSCGLMEHFDKKKGRQSLETVPLTL